MESGCSFSGLTKCREPAMSGWSSAGAFRLSLTGWSHADHRFPEVQPDCSSRTNSMFMMGDGVHGPFSGPAAESGMLSGWNGW